MTPFYIKVVKKKKKSPFCSGLSKIVSCYEKNKIAILFYTNNQYQNKGIKNKKLETEARKFLDVDESKEKSPIEKLYIFNKILEEREKIKEDYHGNNIYDIYNRIAFDTVIIGMFFITKDIGETLILHEKDQVAIDNIIEKYNLNASELFEKLDNGNKICANIEKITLNLFNHYFPNIDYKKNIKEICDIEQEYFYRAKTLKIIFENNATCAMEDENYSLKYLKDEVEIVAEMKEHLPYLYNVILFNSAIKLFNSTIINSQKSWGNFDKLMSKIYFNRVTEKLMWFAHRRLTITASVLKKGDISDMYKLIEECDSYVSLVCLIKDTMILYACLDDHTHFNELKLILEKLYEVKGCLIQKFDFEYFKKLSISFAPHWLVFSAASVSYIEFHLNPWEKSFI